MPTISKIFERVMYIQLYTYFNVNNLLSEQQYGFRSQHSTEIACVKLVDYILKEIDNIRNMKIPASIILDLSKAFDTLTLSGPGYLMSLKVRGGGGGHMCPPSNLEKY